MVAPNLSGTLYRMSGAWVVDRPETPESLWCQDTELPGAESQFATYYTRNVSKKVYYKKLYLWNDGVSVVDYRDDAFDGLLALHQLQPCLRVPEQKAFNRQRKIELTRKSYQLYGIRLGLKRTCIFSIFQ
jgi:hypothetical protein